MSPFRLLILGCTLAGALTCIVTPAHGQSSSASRTKRIQARPGARIAWLAVGRERVQEHLENRRAAGLAVAGADGAVVIEAPVTDEDRLRLAIVDVDLDGTSALPGTTRTSEEMLTLTATAGAAQFVIDAGEVEILYARKNAHVWTYHAHDGGSQDADGVANGRITVALGALIALQGNVHPPDVIASGDVIAVIEPRTLRTAETVVP